MVVVLPASMCAMIPMFRVRARLRVVMAMTVKPSLMGGAGVMDKRG
ncbi:hypothetical protein GCM10023205_17320 [Yinghuangia aomiensis]|uniref:Uncharacterized protein n=1 Tax=Yinghuangia aomiensis TaxID=676205 RepID=A0ABP9GXQ1_9ACTN